MIYLLDVLAAKVLTILFTLFLIAIPFFIGVWIYRLGKKKPNQDQES